MDKLLCIKNFLSVVKHGGFNAAARHAYTSASSLSRQVSALEHQLGGRLLDRSTKKTRLTSLGRAFLEKAERTVSSLDEAFAVGSEIVIPKVGTLKLGLPPALGDLIIRPKVLDFREGHPGIEFYLNCIDTHVDLLSRQCDIYFSSVNIKESSWVQLPIAKVKFMFVGASDYLKQYGRPEQPQDLANHNCILWSSDANPEIWHVGNKKVKVSGGVYSDNGYIMKNLIATGCGIGRLAEFVMKDELEQKIICPILPEYNYELTFYAYYRKESKLINLIEQFCKHLGFIDLR